MADKSYVEQLKGLITEIIEPLRNEIKEQKEITKEQIAKALEDNKGLKEKVEKLESMPAQKLVLPTGAGKGISIYKGYNLAKQGMQVKFADEELKERYAKFVIDVIQKAAMEETTAGQGGYLVPEEYAGGILALARLNSFCLTECDVMDMGTDTLRLPAESTTVTVDTAAETVANSESEPTVTEVVLQPTRFGAYSIASKEMLDDAQIDVVSWLTGLFAEAIGQRLDSEVLNGNVFDGIFDVCTANDVTFNAGAGTSYADMIAEDFSEAISMMANNKTAGAKFVMHRKVFHYVRTIKDSLGQPIFANPGGGVPGTIYEYPYILSDAAPSTDSTSADFISFGNLKNYIIGRRLGDMTLAMDPYGLFTTYQVRFRFAQRWDGKPKFTSAFVRMGTL
jgi:HK97 family phage major capsid protein